MHLYHFFFNFDGFFVIFLLIFKIYLKFNGIFLLLSIQTRLLRSFNKQWRGRGSNASEGGANKAVAFPLEGEKIEIFVAFTRNSIPKSLKTHLFLDETSEIDFLGLKNTVFSKFCSRYSRDFTFNSENLKPNL